jgi:secretion/DNA translocation related TadE-like protein
MTTGVVRDGSGSSRVRCGDRAAGLTGPHSRVTSDRLLRLGRRGPLALFATVHARVASDRYTSLRLRVASDRGGASLWVLAVGLLLVSAGMFGAAVIGAETAHRRAQSAADLGALAGAPLALRGASVACEQAARVVTANGARQVHCVAEGLTLTVRVELDVEPWPGLRATTRAAAHAGPATAPAGPDELPDPPVSTGSSASPAATPDLSRSPQHSADSSGQHAVTPGSGQVRTGRWAGPARSRRRGGWSCRVGGG